MFFQERKFVVFDCGFVFFWLLPKYYGRSGGRNMIIAQLFNEKNSYILKKDFLSGFLISTKPG